MVGVGAGLGDNADGLFLRFEAGRDVVSVSHPFRVVDAVWVLWCVLWCFPPFFSPFAAFCLEEREKKTAGKRERKDGPQQRGFDGHDGEVRGGEEGGGRRGRRKER